MMLRENNYSRHFLCFTLHADDWEYELNLHAIILASGNHAIKWIEGKMYSILYTTDLPDQAEDLLFITLLLLMNYFFDRENDQKMTRWQVLSATEPHICRGRIVII